MAMHHDSTSTSAPPDFTLLPVIFFTGLLLLYVLAAARHPINRGRWSYWRSCSFTVGILLLLIALASPLADFAHRDFRWHMVQHLLIGMFAPLALVLAAPLTLTLRSLPRRAAQWLVRVLHSEFVVWLSHPISALFLNIGGMYVLYLTPLYETSLHSTAVHYWVHIHFLMAGYLFAWAIAGPDPAPRRPSLTTRVSVLFISIATHALLAKLMYIHLFPRLLADDPQQLQDAAKLMYYGGDFAEFMLAAALFYQWYQRRSHTSLKRQPSSRPTIQTRDVNNRYMAD